MWTLPPYLSPISPRKTVVCGSLSWGNGQGGKEREHYFPSHFMLTCLFTSPLNIFSNNILFWWLGSGSPGQSQWVLRGGEHWRLNSEPLHTTHVLKPFGLLPSPCLIALNAFISLCNLSYWDQKIICVQAGSYKSLGDYLSIIK